MTMDRNGVNEYMDDDYSNSTCDCKFCKEKESLRKVLIAEQDGDDILEYIFEDEYDDFGFELVWDDTQKPKPECTCEECHCHDDRDGIIIDLEDELQAAEFCELLADEVESAMIEVLYAFETGEPELSTLEKIENLRDLLRVMEHVVSNEE